MNNTVLAIIEPDTFPDEVAKRAVWIATQYGCDLELLLCDPMLTGLGSSFIASTETQQLVDSIKLTQQAIIGDVAESVSANGLKIEANILYERPISDAIISKAVDGDPTFVVKGTPYHSPAERATFTYTDWRLIRKLHCPVWLVKGGEWKEHPVIIGAVDPTHEHDPKAEIDQKIIEAGKTLVTKTDGNLLLLHTYQRLVEIGSRATKRFKPVKLSVDEIDKKTRDSHRRQLDALAATNGIPSDNVHQLPGRTREILPAFARSHGADIVVMGAIARTGLKRRILGSTAEQVLDHLPCDILLVREN
jgi:universal stress protein E